MKRLFILLLTVMCFASCKKEEAQKEKTDPICMEGRMNWGGEPAADGSGWTFVLAETNKRYYLKDLPETYKQHNLPVAICLEETSEKGYCYCPASQLPPLYRVISIRKK